LEHGFEGFHICFGDDETPFAEPGDGLADLGDSPATEKDFCGLEVIKRLHRRNSLHASPIKDR
jgi:hypothetical protein